MKPSQSLPSAISPLPSRTLSSEACAWATEKCFTFHVNGGTDATARGIRLIALLKVLKERLWKVFPRPKPT